MVLTSSIGSWAHLREDCGICIRRAGAFCSASQRTRPCRAGPLAWHQTSRTQRAPSTWWQDLQVLHSRVPNLNAGSLAPPAVTLRGHRKTSIRPGLPLTTRGDPPNQELLSTGHLLNDQSLTHQECQLLLCVGSPSRSTQAASTLRAKISNKNVFG